MWQSFVFIYALLGVALLLFYTPAVFTKGIFKLEYGELSTQEKLMSWIPIVNTMKAERLYTGRVSLIAISEFTLIGTTLLRVVVATFLQGMYAIQFITVILFLAGIVFFFIANIVVIFIIFWDTKVLGIPTAIFFSVIFPLGQYYIGTFLPTVLKNVGREDETF